MTKENVDEPKAQSQTQSQTQTIGDKEVLVKVFMAKYNDILAMIRAMGYQPDRRVALAETNLEQSYLWLRTAIENYVSPPAVATPMKETKAHLAPVVSEQTH